MSARKVISQKNGNQLETPYIYEKSQSHKLKKFLLFSKTLFSLYNSITDLIVLEFNDRKKNKTKS